MLTSALSAPVGCPRPSVVPHGRGNLTETNRGSFSVGTLLQYSCDPGYTLDGYSIITCTVSGHWSSDPPRCVKNDGMFNLTLFYVLFLFSHQLYSVLRKLMLFTSCQKIKFLIRKKTVLRQTSLWKLWFLLLALTQKFISQQFVNHQVSRRTEDINATPWRATDWPRVPWLSTSVMRVTFWKEDTSSEPVTTESGSRPCRSAVTLCKVRHTAASAWSTNSAICIFCCLVTYG